MTQTVVGVFDRYAAARDAADRLAASGFDRDQIHVKAARGQEGDTLPAPAEDRDTGLMSGVRSFFAEVFGSDDYREEAGTYAEAVRRGHAVVAVEAEESRLDIARDTLERAGALDIDEQVSTWRQSGWSGFDDSAAPYTDEDIERERQTVMPVMREELEVGKRQVGGGTVRVFTHTVSEPTSQSMNLRSETAEVERRPVDRPASQADLAGFQERTVEVKESAEKPVVNKVARVVEEVVVSKKVRQQTHQVKDNVRRTEVKVERDGRTDSAASRRAFEDYDSDFRSDYDRLYASTGGSYDDYVPAYRYGYTMASDPLYAGQDWSAVEPQARQQWESQYPDSPWERFKAAIRHGWERVTS